MPSLSLVTNRNFIFYISFFHSTKNLCRAFYFRVEVKKNFLTPLFGAAKESNMTKQNNNGKVCFLEDFTVREIN